MSERPGLSIFDTKDERSANDADDATAVIEAVPAQQREAEPTPRPSPPASAASGSGASATGSAAVTGFPVVRRGGYDTAAVDRQMHVLAGERAGLAAGLESARARIAELEKAVRENETPTYAGLGGRASEMLRLAEE